MIELEKMSYSGLIELRSSLDEAIARAKMLESEALRARMEALAAESGLSIDDVLGGSQGGKKGSKARIKYRNPADGSTWAGRGRQPRWMVEALKNGHNVENFRV